MRAAADALDLPVPKLSRKFYNRNLAHSFIMGIYNSLSRFRPFGRAWRHVPMGPFRKYMFVCNGECGATEHAFAHPVEGPLSSPSDPSIFAGKYIAGIADQGPLVQC